MKLTIYEWAFATVIGAVFAGVVSSCDVAGGGGVDPDNRIPISDSDQRFTVTRHGKFSAGFDNNTREILIITDSQTKRTYLGITGVGVTEMRTETTGENTVTTER